MSLSVPWWLATAGGVAVTVMVGWAWRREVRLGGGAWRRAALMVMGICLWSLLAGPAGKGKPDPGTVVLISAEARPAALEGLPHDWPRWALPGAPAESGEAVADLELAVRQRRGVERWAVAGVGLEPWQLALLPGEVSFVVPERPRVGIDRARWERRIALGQALEVRGSVRLNPGAEGRLRMIGPAGIEGEATVLDGSPFTLRATPRQQGRLLYRLELAVADEVLADEMVDVEVVAPRPPRVLWLEGAPSFESREVKTWLRDLGGELVLRSRISRGRFRYEFVNRERQDFTRVSPALLAEFDVLVVDPAAWRSLARTEVQGVEEAVEAGLGLLFLPTRVPESEIGLAEVPFSIQGVGDLESLEVEPEGPGLEPLAPLEVRARQFVERSGQRPLLSDGAGRPLAVLRPRGLGRVAATVVEESYRWVLRGQAGSHHSYWSQLLSPLARAESAARLVLPPGPIWRDRATAVTLLADGEGRLELLGPEGRVVPVAPVQDSAEPEIWRATMWPREVGWHHLRGHLRGGSEVEASLAFFVVEANAWSALRQRQAHDATGSRALLGTAGPAAGGASPAEPRESSPRPLPRWPFFALLVAAWASLWSNEQWRGASVAPSPGAGGA